MSDSLPNSGVIAVQASRYAVTTQLRFSTSCSVRPIVGSAGATMVCSSAERNMASRMPTMIARIEAWSSCFVGSGECMVRREEDAGGGEYYQITKRAADA